MDAVKKRKMVRRMNAMRARMERIERRLARLEAAEAQRNRIVPDSFIESLLRTQTAPNPYRDLVEP